MDQLIEQWFARHFQGIGPKLDTELYNLIHAAKEDLKRILGQPASPTTASDNPEGEE